MACAECLADEGHWPKCGEYKRQHQKPKPPPDPPKKPDPKR